MVTTILATKLYIPSRRSTVVVRPRLIERLNEGLHRKLTLISAAAGFGKTTLVSDWVANLKRPVAWLSLDQGDNDASRFLAYLVAALQTIDSNIGKGILGVLHSPQPPPIETILTILLNEISAVPLDFVVVLDDYHVIDSKPVDNILTLLLAHLPPQLHLMITTREDPQFPLARLRARAQLNELRIADLRFTVSEATEFLNLVMGLHLTAEDIAALETRTEGWIAGLQIAAISMQGHKDSSKFVKSFTGSHHFVMDYLVEEVLQQQPERIQTFLLHTSILERLCGSLCDAVLGNDSASGQTTLEYLERTNLFIVQLDDERRWYRYHHLFADLLRQRLHSGDAVSGANNLVSELHIRASQWYEDNGLELEAFHHAAAANDIERAERLIEGRGIPLHFRGAVTTILNWLASLPTSVLNARPSLWWRYGALLLVNGQTTGVEAKLDAAEAALQYPNADDKTRHLIGRVAAARAVLALTRYQVESMIVQSRRALEYIPLDSLSLRANANWTLGYAYLFQKDYTPARHFLHEAVSLSQACGDVFTFILASLGLGIIHEAENQLHLAVQTYRQILQLAGDQPLQIIYEAHLGLARVLYEWNDLTAAEQHGRQSLQLAREYDAVIDRFVICEVFLARLKLAQGDITSAVAILAQADHSARQQNFVFRIPEIAAAQVLVLLRRGNLAAADHLTRTHHLPLCQARVHLAQDNPLPALALLEPLSQQAQEKGWKDERLRIMVLQSVAYQAQGDNQKAVQAIGEALAVAEPQGFIRLFIDEGEPMARLLSKATAFRVMPDYVRRLLAVFETENANTSRQPVTESPIEPLSTRELEVLRLVAQGLSNAEIADQLFLALDTVKGHNRRIFEKLQVQRRTEAVARARELGLV